MRVGFDINNAIAGELPFQKSNAIINFLIVSTKQYIFFTASDVNIEGLWNRLKTNYCV